MLISNKIHYFRNFDCTNMYNGENVLVGQIKQENGNINISSLHKGNYILSIYENNQKLLERKWVQK